MREDYTCGCGLYVHPLNPDTNPKAIHIEDCPFNREVESELPTVFILWYDCIDYHEIVDNCFFDNREEAQWYLDNRIPKWQTYACIIKPLKRGLKHD